MSDLSLPASLSISTMAANSTFSMSINSGQSVYWGLGDGGESGVGIAGSGSTSGSLQNFSVNDTTISLTNGGQSQNWALTFSVIYPEGTSVVNVNINVSPAPALITFYGSGEPQNLSTGQATLRI